jgi:hypothetical protein
MIFSTTNMFSDFVKKYDGKCLVSTVEGNSIDIFTTRGISNELALLEVNFEGTKIDIQSNDKLLYCSILIVSILLSGPVLHITSLLTS